MLVLASLYSEFIADAGSVAATMAVGAFVGQAGPALSGGAEASLRRGAAFGGLAALSLAIIIVVLSAP